jgi:hypothetical protein
MKIGKAFSNNGEIDSINTHLLEIGDNCVLGGESKIILHCPIRSYKKDPRVIIDDFVWIGTRCSILPATHIGRNVLVGANSVVFGEIAPYSIYAGTKVVRKREIGEILNWFIVRVLNGGDGRSNNREYSIFGCGNTHWDLLKMEHIKCILGYDTEICYDKNIDFNLSTDDFVKKYAGDWANKTTNIKQHD